MGQALSSMHVNHMKIRKHLNVLHCDAVRVLARRWKEAGIPFFLSIKEFQKIIVKDDDIHINYAKYAEAGCDIEVVEFLTCLVITSTGPIELRFKYLFELYQFEDETTITPDEFYVCIDKCIRSICEEGQMQFPYIDREGLEEFKVGNIQDLVTREENITFEEFKHALEQECTKFAQILQETHNFLRNLSTLIIENPFPVISFLQKGNLFLGKYEITETPKLIDDISSIYKRKYKHALLEVKPMIGGGNKLKFELIYLAGIQGDESFRQNYFREIVLKNKLRKEEQNEFGELPGGVLYKRISELEATELTLDEYLEAQDAKMKETYSNVKNKRILVCMNEEQAIELGMHLLDQLEILHNMDVLHSNINPTSVYLLEQDITKPAFLDLELAIWDPMQILNSSSRYFQQLPGDKYDTTFRDEKYLPPEHKELAEEYRKTNKIPKQEITNQCDLYSIGAIIYRALTGKPPASFSEDTQDHPNHTSERDLLGEWTCPQELEQLCISNGMASFLIKALAKDLTHRHKSIKEMRDDLVHLSTRLSKIPKPLLKGLEHTSKKSSMLEDSFVLDLHEWNIEDYGLEYLYKFIVESNIPNIRLFGEAILQIRDLRDNRITELNLQNKLLSYEELKLLSFFIKINSSLREIDLSKNPLFYRRELEPLEGDMENTALKTNRLSSDLGFKYFKDALMRHTELISFEMAQVELGPDHCSELCIALARNTKLERLNLSGCSLGPNGVKVVCEITENMKFIRYINLSSNSIGNQGAICVARLLERNHNILEIDLFRNCIEKEGGEAIGKALTSNFIIQKLSIGDNDIEQNEKDLILQSVMFNTQYKKLKATNLRFGEFGYNLMAESIKRWTETSKFVQDNLKARLQQSEDEIDAKLAEILLDSNGNLNLSNLSFQYNYSPEEWSRTSER